MPNSSHPLNEPGAVDVVLGGQNPAPAQAGILGGLAGVQQRLKYPLEAVRSAALPDVLRYGELGVDLLLDALMDASEEVQEAAKHLLWHHGGTKASAALAEFSPEDFFTQFKDWREQRLYPGYRISNPHLIAYDIHLAKANISPRERLETLYQLLQDERAGEIEALKCSLVDWQWNRYQDFQIYVNALVEAQTQLPKLKALAIRNTASYGRERYANRYPFYLANFYPLLQAYPQLEVLHLRGWAEPKSSLLKGQVEVVKVRRQGESPKGEIRNLKHTHLRTLVLETVNLTDSHVAQICSLHCPSLEYFEFWLRGNLSAQATVRALAPILSGESFPNLTCLRLPCSDHADEIAKAIAQSPLINRLRVLDLSKGRLTDRGAAALIACPAINHLHTLEVSRDDLSIQSVEKLRRKSCHIITGYESDRYYSSIE